MLSRKIICVIFIVFIVFGSNAYAGSKVVFPNQSLKGYKVRTLDALLKLDDKEIDYSVAALILAKAYKPSVDIDANLKKLDKLVMPIYKKLKKNNITDPLEVIWAINHHLFKVARYRYRAIADYRLFLLNEVMKYKMGHCFGLSTLYMCIGQRLGLEFKIVTCYRHVFIQYNGKNVIRLETGDHGNHFELASLYNPKNTAAIHTGQSFKPMRGKKFLALYCKDLASYMSDASQKALARMKRTRNRQARAALHARALKMSDNCNKYIDISLRLYPNLYTALFLKGLIYFNMGWKDSALFYFKRAFEGNVGDPLVAVYYARIYFAKKDFATALKILEKNIVYNQKNPSLWNNLAICCLQLKKYKKCVVYANKAVALHRRYLPAYACLAEAYLKLKQYFNAKWTSKRLVDYAPRYILGYLVLAEAYLLEGKPYKARDVFNSMAGKVMVRASYNRKYFARLMQLAQKIRAAVQKKKIQEAVQRALQKQRQDLENKKKAKPKPRVKPVVKPKKTSKVPSGSGSSLGQGSAEDTKKSSSKKKNVKSKKVNIVKPAKVKTIKPKAVPVPKKVKKAKAVKPKAKSAAPKKK